MRNIGQLASEEDAHRFQNYLRSLDIENQTDQTDGVWEVWILEEDDLETARKELKNFEATPRDAKYNVRPPIKKQSAQAPVKSRVVTGTGRTTLTLTLISVSIVVSVLTDFGNTRPDLIGSFLITNHIGNSLPEILHGKVWRLYTPMFLHFSMPHLLFNCYATWILAGMIERIRGARFLLVLVLLIAPVSHLTQFILFSGAFGGLSGVVYGLFGFIWLRARLVPEEGYLMPNVIVVQMLLWLFLCLSGALGPVANGAHFGGLIAGMLLGAFPVLQKR